MSPEGPDTDVRTEIDRVEPVDGSVDTDRSAPSVLELDTVFTALSDSRRRYLLYSLTNGDGSKTASALATEIASWELEKPIGEVTDGERKEILISLYHAHLPKLADLDMVEYEEGDRILVRPTDTPQVRAVLEGVDAELVTE